MITPRARLHLVVARARPEPHLRTLRSEEPNYRVVDISLIEGLVGHVALHARGLRIDSDAHSLIPSDANRFV